jgi:hypothetical protein
MILTGMFTSQLVTTDDYARPDISDCLAIKSGRHPVREKVGLASLPASKHNFHRNYSCSRRNMFPMMSTLLNNADSRLSLAST